MDEKNKTITTHPLKKNISSVRDLFEYFNFLMFAYVVYDFLAVVAILGEYVDIGTKIIRIDFPVIGILCIIFIITYALITRFFKNKFTEFLVISSLVFSCGIIGGKATLFIISLVNPKLTFSWSLRIVMIVSLFLFFLMLKAVLSKNIIEPNLVSTRLVTMAYVLPTFLLSVMSNITDTQNYLIIFTLISILPEHLKNNLQIVLNKIKKIISDNPKLSALFGILIGIVLFIVLEPTANAMDGAGDSKKSTGSGSSGKVPGSSTGKAVIVGVAASFAYESIIKIGTKIGTVMGDRIDVLQGSTNEIPMPDNHILRCPSHVPVPEPHQSRPFITDKTYEKCVLVTPSGDKIPVESLQKFGVGAGSSPAKK